MTMIVEAIPTKVCTKCKIEKTIDRFFVDNQKKDALSCWCKECKQLNFKSRVKKYRSRAIDNIPTPDTKLCPKCHRMLPNKDFGKNTASVNGLMYCCKQCQNKYMNELRIKKAEARKGKIGIVKTKKCYVCGKLWPVSYFSKNWGNADGLQSKCKACEKIWNKQYFSTKAGKDADKRSTYKRRALKKHLRFEVFNPSEIFERDRYICQLCGKKTRPNVKNKFHPLYPNLDHIVPLSLGGEHTKQNTQCLCLKCNMTKNNTGVGDQLRIFG